MNGSQHEQAPAGTSDRPVAFSVLSLDGGGIRGLSSLLILEQVMVKITGDSKSPLYPWKYFEIIAGTSTGGLIALMLGRLRMSVQDAIKAYIQLGEEIFSSKKWFWKEGWYKKTTVERAIKKIIGEAESGGRVDTGHPEDLAMKKGFLTRAFGRNAKKYSVRDEENEARGEEVTMKDTHSDRCRTFVCSVDSKNITDPILFRTYSCPEDVPSEDSRNVANSKVWEAARATSAAPLYFKPFKMKKSNGGEGISYVDGGLRCNNPTRRLLSEIRRLELSDKRVCVLTIGTGRVGPISIRDASYISMLQLFNVARALADIATNCEIVNDELGEDLVTGDNVYVRLNVGTVMDVRMEDWKKCDRIIESTTSYLEGPEVREKLEELSRHIRMRPECEEREECA